MFDIGDRVVVMDGSDLIDYTCEWNPHMNKFVNSVFTICSVITFARDRVGYCFAELQDTEDSDYIFDGRRLRPEGLVWVRADDRVPDTSDDEPKLVALNNGKFAVAVYSDHMWIDAICGLVYDVPHTSPFVIYWSDIPRPIPIQTFSIANKAVTQPMMPKTLEAAIDYLNECGWLPEHDRFLTQVSEE